MVMHTAPLAQALSGKESLLLGIDTCGPAGSVALGRMADGVVEVLGETPLEGRSYSATLVAAVEQLLAASGVALRELGCIVAVKGPGSFTGVRVGLSASKGLAEAAGLPLLAVSRLEVLAAMTEVEVAALDAHRGEVFLRLAGEDDESRELLAGPHELAAIAPRPERAAVCDDAAGALLAAAWPAAHMIWSPAPGASDALRVAAGRGARAEFVDPAMLDGNYLRRSDAEIFGGTAEAPGDA